ncbi:MAG: hypothetical protein P4L83_01395 [Nevskia sp.]|nr:hypothetical protein [Nevskia sp.]
MPKISSTGQGRPVDETRRGREAQGTDQSRFCFLRLIGAASGAALFGYFLSLETKSDPPFMAEQNGSEREPQPREARAAASAHFDKRGVHRNENWIPAYARMTTSDSTATPTSLDAGFRRHDGV